MKEPVRLRETGGAARALLGAGKLEVPHTSRQRALAFTGVAASLATTGTAAAAGATSLVKSVALCVCLGTMGGGLASLAVSETVARWQAPDAEPAATATFAKRATAAAQPAAAAAPDAVSEPEAAPAPPAVPAEPAAVANHASGAALAAPLAAPPSSSSKPRVSSLFEEQRIIESARAAVSRGDAHGALATLDGYARAYGQGQFGPEAMALRIEALSAKGDLGRARGLAGEFHQRYPHHPLLAPVQTAVQGPASTKR
jgi:hypothetical protein